MKKYNEENNNGTSNLADMIAVAIAIILAIVLIFVVTPLIARSHPKVNVEGVSQMSEVYYDCNNE